MDVRGLQWLCVSSLTKFREEGRDSGSRISDVGLRRGAFQGLGPTALKECPSYGVYFLVYEQSKRLSEGHLPTVPATLLSGGLAGCVALGAFGCKGRVRKSHQLLN
eukprot:s723_g19.t1